MGSLFDNPSPIQGPHENRPYTGGRPPAPLVLIHDGGGTIFSYHCLGDLARDVYGISNPHYQTGEKWGSIPEMAREYVKFVRAAVPRGGPVILGGWSLGGLVSLEVARQLANDDNSGDQDQQPPRLTVLGIVMIDSVCPLGRTAPILPVVRHALVWGEHTRQDTKDRIMRCFAEASDLIGRWTLPEWPAPADPGPGPGPEKSRPSPPPVVLLRATDPVPVPADYRVDAAADANRRDRRLGWGRYREDLIVKVIDVPGHHFTVFIGEDRLAAMTEAIRQACRALEG
ncbi:hypothetical protein VTK26DRAFT_7475 [Humicola hyalothermophila]